MAVKISVLLNGNLMQVDGLLRFTYIPSGRHCLVYSLNEKTVQETKELNKIYISEEGDPNAEFQLIGDEEWNNIKSIFHLLSVNPNEVPNNIQLSKLSEMQYNVGPYRKLAVEDKVISSFETVRTQEPNEETIAPPSGTNKFFDAPTEDESAMDNSQGTTQVIDAFNTSPSVLQDVAPMSLVDQGPELSQPSADQAQTQVQAAPAQDANQTQTTTAPAAEVPGQTALNQTPDALSQQAAQPNVLVQSVEPAITNVEQAPVAVTPVPVTPVQEAAPAVPNPVPMPVAPEIAQQNVSNSNIEYIDQTANVAPVAPAAQEPVTPVPVTPVSETTQQNVSNSNIEYIDQTANVAPVAPAAQEPVTPVPVTPVPEATQQNAGNSNIEYIDQTASIAPVAPASAPVAPTPEADNNTQEEIPEPVSAIKDITGGISDMENKGLEELPIAEQKKITDDGALKEESFVPDGPPELPVNTMEDSFKQDTNVSDITSGISNTQVGQDNQTASPVTAVPTAISESQTVIDTSVNNTQSVTNTDNSASVSQDAVLNDNQTNNTQPAPPVDLLAPDMSLNPTTNVGTSDFLTSAQPKVEETNTNNQGSSELVTLYEQPEEEKKEEQLANINPLSENRTETVLTDSYSYAPFRESQVDAMSNSNVNIFIPNEQNAPDGNNFKGIPEVNSNGNIGVNSSEVNTESTNEQNLSSIIDTNVVIPTGQSGTTSQGLPGDSGERSFSRAA